MTSFWFLYTLFICCALFLMLKWVSNIVASVIIVSLVTLALPGLEFIKFSIPFFGIGLIMKKYDILHKVSIRPVIVIALLALSLASYYFLWNNNWYIYITSNPNLFHFESQKWMAYAGRLIQGSLMSIAILASIIEVNKRIYPFLIFRKLKHSIELLSTNSLGLYVMHLFILMVISKIITIPDIRISLSQTAITILALIIAALLVSLLVPLIELMSRSRILKYHC